jgi:aspartate/methionine/tyrosine aminotransferase
MTAVHQPAVSHSAGKCAVRMREIAPFHVMEIQKRARILEAGGRDIVHLEIGEPDFSTPEPVVEAGKRALAAGSIAYTAALGIAELRQAIADYYASRYQLAISPERVIVTAGSSAALLLAFGATVNAGEEILMPDPCYPCNRHFLHLMGAKARLVEVDASTHFQPTAAMLEAHWTGATAGVLLASPANPTGMLVADAELRSMLDLVRSRGGLAFIDEIYHGLTYDRKPPSALAFDPGIYLISSFSKYFNMTGWRLGWMIAPQDRVRDIEKLAQNLFICASQPAQYAALAAFLPETLAIAETRREELKRRRDYLVPALRNLGFGVPVVPDGAFYVYADCSALAPDSYAFALRVLDEAGVAITPGNDFGVYHAERYLRFAYTQPIARLEEAVSRIGKLIG